MKRTIPKRNKPAVSVLLPVYNAAASLTAAVDSLRSQSLTDWELLLIDDGSTDGSREAALKFAAEDARIRMLSAPHRGIVSALNLGLAHARAEIVARMDADDVCHPERLEKQLDFLGTHPETDVVSCRVDYGGDRETQAGYAAYVDWQNGLLSPGDHFANRFVDATVAHPSVMFRRRTVDARGGYREGAFPEDFELWLRWMEGGVRFAKVPEALLTWNDPPGRLSRRDDRYATEAFYALKCEYLQRAVPADRPLWLWGAGRKTRRRFASLAPFAGYIDVDPKKLGQRIDGRPVISPEEIPPGAFVLSGVSLRGARELIENRLKNARLRAARDYYLCA